MASILNYKNLYNIEKLRYEEGISSSMDVVNSEKSYISAQNDLIELKKYHHTMLNQFAVLIGESPENINNIKRKSLDEINYTKKFDFVQHVIFYDCFGTR